MQAIAKFLSPKAPKDEPKKYYTPAFQRPEKYLEFLRKYV